jgi:hypothetical protein
MLDSNQRIQESKSCALPTWRIPNIGVPEGIRTPDTRLRRAVLYPAELQAHIFFGAGEGGRTLAAGLEGRNSTTELHPLNLERKTRFELATLALARRCSTTELLPLIFCMVRVEGLEPPRTWR